MASRAKWYTLCDFSVYRLRENLVNQLVVGRSQSPAKSRLRCFANAPQVERLHALAGAEYGGALLAGKKVVPLVGEASVGRTAAPSGGDRKGHRWRRFSGAWVVLGFLPRMKIAPAGESIFLSWASCAERWKPVFRGSG